jgi:predicted metal-dependent HD superfamily phosphohydrolase
MDRLSLDAWTGLWRRLGARSDPRPWHLTVHRAYTEPHRHYHTREHIARTLGLLDAVSARLSDPAAAELAVWLHDVVYNPRAPDNEERSAALAGEMLADGSVAPPVIERVRALILATRHGGAVEAPEDHDARYVVDADLSILGATPVAFDRYERQVRQEYLFVAEPEWRARRAELLRRFLQRPRLFETPEFASFEAPARANLERSIDRLVAGAAS